MSLTAFKQKIVQQASADAQALADQNALRIAEMRDSAAKEIRALEESIITTANKEAERHAQSIHQQAELKARSLVLAAKQEELDALKEAFVTSLTKLSTAEKKSLHTALLALVPKSKGKVTPQEDGGLVFHGEGMEVDLSLPRLVDQLFIKYRSELAKELFA